MTIADILAVFCGGAVGLILALIGGGGSILATPALLYVVGVADAHAAIGTSALAVSVNAFANLINHARRGNVHWRSAAIFAAFGAVGSIAGASIGRVTDAHILLPLFAVLMIVVGVTMLRRSAHDTHAPPQVNARATARLLFFGAIVGLISGFFGIGGGFLIVPGLILATGMGMMYAIGSSLFSVGVQGAATASTYALDGAIDWRVALLFIAGGIAGGVVGAAYGARLSQQRGALQRVFACVVFATAAYMLYRSLIAPG